MSGRPGVRALGAMATVVGVWLACSGGLNVEEGNPFPCDFRREEAVRDAQCPPKWRCGIDGRCHEAEDEQSPLVTPPAFQGTRRFPRVLSGDTHFIAAEPLSRLVLTGYEDGGVYVTQMGGAQAQPGLNEVRQVALAGNYLLVQGESSAAPLKLYTRGPNGALMSERVVRDEANAEVTQVKFIRALSYNVATEAGPPLTRLMFAVVRENGLAGEVDPVSGQYTSFPEAFSLLGDGGLTTCNPRVPGGCRPEGFISGRYTEARHVVFSQLATGRQQSALPQLASVPVPVVATTSHILWREQPPGMVPPQGQWQVLYTSDVASAPPPSPPVQGDGGAPPMQNDAGSPPAQGDGGLPDWMMRHSERANLWALKRQLGDREVLSTFEVSRAPNLPGPAMSLAWDDCAPCGDGTIITFIPVTDGSLGVEVLCESRRGVRSLLRVVGSSVVAPRDPCLVQPLTAPFELKELASRQLPLGIPQFKKQAMDESRGASVVMGGAHGQIWGGSSLSRMRPVFLDRAPVAVEAFVGGGLLAFTPDFIALGPPDNASQFTGMVVAGGPPDSGLSDRLGLGNVVQGLPNWLLGEAGQLVQMEYSLSGGLSLSSSYGPRLVAPSGEAATGPFLGQGTGFDGGASLLLAANDQLYYVDVLRAELKPDPAEVKSLTPRLTPDPSFPVRSLARDRTVSPTAQTGARVRGWASTDRSVVQFEQAAETGGWTMSPLPIGDGEPVEVWSREAGSTSYGRLGLRDGLVLRLPQGLPLTQLLPEGERVVDYASLAGWPVALGERAIYRTVPTQPSSGQPGLLAWEPLPLPDGLTAADLEGARITVVTDQGTPALYLFLRTGFVYRLGEGAR